jgi:putative ABC transport system permease protein
LEDNVKSSAPLAVAGVLGCILIAGCVQTREANVPSPPATSYQVGSFELQESGSSQNVRGASVTPVFFQGAKIPTLLGRGFLPEEYGSGTQQVIMVSHRLWQKRFRGDPRIIGTSIRVNGQAFTVIGIMPTTFDVPSGVDIWVPKAG